MAGPTDQDYANAEVDLQTVALFTNGDETQDAIPLRLGGTTKSLRNAAATLAKGNTGETGPVDYPQMNRKISAMIGTGSNIFDPAGVTDNDSYKPDGSHQAGVGAQFHTSGGVNIAGMTDFVISLDLFTSSGYGYYFKKYDGTILGGVTGVATPKGTVLHPPSTDTETIWFMWMGQDSTVRGVFQGDTLPAEIPEFGIPTINQVNDAIAAALPAGGALGIADMNHAIAIATGSPINRFNPTDAIVSRVYRWDGTVLDGGVGVGFTGTPVDVRGYSQVVCNFGFHSDATYGWYFEDADGNYLPAVGYVAGTSLGTPPALIAGQFVWRLLNCPTGAAMLYTFSTPGNNNGDGSNNPATVAGYAVVTGSAVPSRVPTHGLATADQVVDRRPGLNTKSAWYGDSYLATYWTKWLPIIEALTGTAFSVADGQAGEATAGMFGHFSAAPPTGVALHDDTWSVGTTTYLRGYTIGQTLAQILTAGNVKYFFIALGTNDVATSPSTLAAQATANIRAVRGVYPSARIFYVGPMFCAGEPGGTLAVWKAIDAALQGACDDSSVPYLSMLKVSGVDDLTAATLQRDNIHLTDAAYADMYAPTIAAWAGRYMNPS